MKCKKCRKEIPDGSKFCNLCGTPQKSDKMYRRPDGLYEKVKTIDGKRVYFRGKTEKEVERQMLEYTERPKKGEPFATVADLWWEEHSPTLAPNSINNYEPAYNRAVDYFDDEPINNIKASNISKYLQSLPSSFAQKTLLTHLQIVNMICKYAVINDYLDNNPADYIKIPRGRSKTHRRPPTQSEIDIIKSNTGIPFGLYAYLLICTGCRRGEALALQQKDIDRSKNVISISKSVYYLSNQPNIKQPKTDSGIRNVILLDVLKQLLPEGSPDDYIFGGERPMTHSAFRCAWNQYQKKTGLVELTPHMVRHGYATILHEANIDIKDAQELLGHANIATTMDIYTHITQKRREKTAQKLKEYAENTQDGLIVTVNAENE